MLSYQHIFHAGNHADILKHFVLYEVLLSLNKKEKPYVFFDTHSGSGLYDLQDSRSLKTLEAEKGILKLVQDCDGASASEVFNDFLNFILKYTKKNFYPGSPEIERRLMRPCDTLVLSELHPQEIENLKKNMHGDLFEGDRTDNLSGKTFPSVQIHNRNGWEMLRALTPPVQKRGGVLIDPSYEETADYTDAARTVCEVHKKWSGGIILLWYPLLVHRESDIKGMIDSICRNAMAQNPHVEICNMQLCAYDKNTKDMPRLYGSGMLVLNTPWKLLEETEKAFDGIKSVSGFRFQKEDTF